MKKCISLFVCLALLGSCEKDAGSKTASVGTGGSLAKFTVVDDYLYLADQTGITAYNISNAANPVYHGFTPVGFGIETIFPYQDKLFVGSTQGMYIYSIKKPGVPEKLGQALHVRSCDPVVANEQHSYVTLRSGTPCGDAVAGLYIYDITSVESPQQKGFLELSEPYGLGLKDSLVFVCRDTGLSVINVKDVTHPKELYTITGNQYRDVIPYDNLLICYVTTGLLLFDVSDPNTISKVAQVKYQ